MLVDVLIVNMTSPLATRFNLGICTPWKVYIFAGKCRSFVWLCVFDI